MLIACENNSTELVSLLVAFNAKVTCRDFLQNTPLHKAAEKGCEDIIKILIDKGADLNVRNNRNQIPLNMTTKQHIIKLLEGLGKKIRSFFVM